MSIVACPSAHFVGRGVGTCLSPLRRRHRHLPAAHLLGSPCQFLLRQVVQLTNQLRRRVKLCLHMIEKCVPIRLQACHAMYPPSRSVALLIRPVMLSLTSRKVRQRTVTHVGGPGEHASRLESYGMSHAGIPVEFGGTCVF
jgi:hypothetical protein